MKLSKIIFLISYIVIFFFISCSNSKHEKFSNMFLLEYKDEHIKYVLKEEFNNDISEIIFTEKKISLRKLKKMGIKNLNKYNSLKKVKVIYPKVIFKVSKDIVNEKQKALFVNSIQFFDAKGKIIKVQKVKKDESIRKSDNYILVHGSYGDKENPIRILLLNHNGKLIFKKSGIITKDYAILDSTLSNDGTFALLFGKFFSGIYYEIITRKGEIQKIETNFCKDFYIQHFESNAGNIFSKDNELFTIAVVKYKKLFKYAILKISQNKELLWVNYFPKETAMYPKIISISNINKCIVIQYTKEIIENKKIINAEMFIDIIDMNGNLISRRNINEVLGVSKSYNNSRKIKVKNVIEKKNSLFIEILFYKNNIEYIKKIEVNINE